MLQEVVVWFSGNKSCPKKISFTIAPKGKNWNFINFPDLHLILLTSPFTLKSFLVHSVVTHSFIFIWLSMKLGGWSNLSNCSVSLLNLLSWDCPSWNERLFMIYFREAFKEKFVIWQENSFPPNFFITRTDWEKIYPLPWNLKKNLSYLEIVQV